ncbi:MAG: formylglycine-generating enzyme family protein [Candidatus Brocadiia bacterium]
MRMALVIAAFLLFACGCCWLALSLTSDAPPPPFDIIKSAPLPLVKISPGSFIMGSENGEDDEKPVHKVTLTQAFYMGATEVTQAQYRAVMHEYTMKFNGDNLPVESIPWDDAVEFCHRLTVFEQASGHLPVKMEYRLPTEAEWEYCCRAGSTSEYCFGDDPKLLGEYAWFGEERGKGPHPVGMKKPNAWGLYDMHGNADEWVQDWYSKYPSDVAALGTCLATDPVGPEAGAFHLIRGGTWSQEAKSCRSACRSFYRPGFFRTPQSGFRVVVASSYLPEDEPPARKTQEQNEPLPACLDGAPLTLVTIHPGSFLMGSQTGQPDTQPVHRVNIEREFYIGATEVTQAQFRSVTGDNPSHYKGDILPVDSVSWFDAMEFCRKLTLSERKAGRLPPAMEYRLPTEAEWEYACRAGSTTAFCCGNDAKSLDRYAWFDRNFRPRQLHAVGRKLPNAWGLFDVHGGVSEWCFDWYSEGWYAAGGDQSRDPIGPSSGNARIVRGGSRHSPAAESRSDYRDWVYPDCPDIDTGFRVVVAAPVVQPAFLPFTGVVPKNAPIPLVAIHPGTFRMGSEKTDYEKKRIRNVTVSRGFYIGTTEVTQGQYREAMGENPSHVSAVLGLLWSEDLPADSVTWFDAMEFCSRLTEAERKAGRLPEGMAYRLPTEAEWEYCCRAGSTTEYCFGDNPKQLGDYAWFGKTSVEDEFQPSDFLSYDDKPSGYGRRPLDRDSDPLPVGGKKPNAWGLFDMHGNVWEWCLDGRRSLLTEAQKRDGFPGIPGEQLRYVRGGSVFTRDEGCRSASYWALSPDESNRDIGFRVVLAEAQPRIDE